MLTKAGLSTSQTVISIYFKKTHFEMCQQEKEKGRKPSEMLYFYISLKLMEDFKITNIF